jgi:hypothetical protein
MPRSNSSLRSSRRLKIHGRKSESYGTPLLELEVHAKLEEMLIYPAIREEIDAEDVLDEALEEHHVAHTLINELKRRTGSKGRYEAKFKVLGESIKHHVKEEEGTMFPEAEKADIDWEALAQEAMERKEALKARITGMEHEVEGARLDRRVRANGGNHGKQHEGAD